MISRRTAFLCVTPVAALAQISPCGSGQQLGNNAVITSGNAVYSSPGYVSAGSLSVNVVGNSVSGNATLTIQAGTAICLGPGFKAAATSSGGGFKALIGSTPPAGAFAVTTTSLAGANQGTSYQQTLNASGGIPAYTWSVVSGSLPAGISLNGSSGAIGGMPSAPGGSNFTVQAEDSSGQIASRSYLMIVAPAQPQSASPRGQSATYVYTGSVSQTYSYTLSNGGDSRYITGCSVSGAGVTTAVTTYPGTVNFDIVYTAAPNTQTGSRSVTCSWVYSDGSQRFSLTISGDTLHVYDAAPVITSTQLLSPLYPGGQAYVAIYGTGFGPAQGGLAVCRTGATPCGNSDVAGTVVYWNHGVSYDQVNVLLAAGLTASGAYDVQLTSRGSTGSGFLQNPNGPDPNNCPICNSASEVMKMRSFYFALYLCLLPVLAGQTAQTDVEVFPKTTVDVLGMASTDRLGTPTMFREVHLRIPLPHGANLNGVLLLAHDTASHGFWWLLGGDGDQRPRLTLADWFASHSVAFVAEDKIIVFWDQGPGHLYVVERPGLSAETIDEAQQKAVDEIRRHAATIEKGGQDTAWGARTCRCLEGEFLSNSGCLRLTATGLYWVEPRSSAPPEMVRTGSLS